MHRYINVFQCVFIIFHLVFSVCLIGESDIAFIPSLASHDIIFRMLFLMYCIFIYVIIK